MKTFMLFLIPFYFLQAQEKIDLEKAQEYYSQGKVLYYDGDYAKAEIAFDSCIILRERHLDYPAELLLKAYQRKGNNHIKQKRYKPGEEALIKAKKQAELLFGNESSEVAGLLVDLAIMESRRYRFT